MLNKDLGKLNRPLGENEIFFKYHKFTTTVYRALITAHTYNKDLLSKRFITENKNGIHILRRASRGVAPIIPPFYWR